MAKGFKMSGQNDKELEPRTLPDLPDIPLNKILESDIKADFYPELYLTVLTHLAFEDSTRTPGRNSEFNESEDWKGSTKILNRRLVTLTNVFASVAVQKPRDNVYAVGLVYEKVPNPIIILGGDREIEPAVEKLYLDIWKCLGDIADCYEDVADGRGSIKDPSPKGTQLKTDRSISEKESRGKFHEAQLKLMEVLVLHSFKKLRHRISKYFSALEDVVKERNRLGWRDDTAKRLLLLMVKAFGEILNLTPLEAGGEPKSPTARDARSFACKLMSTQEAMKALSAATGPTVSSDTGIDHALDLADTEIKQCYVCKTEGFDIRRYAKKSFSLTYYFKILTKAAMSWRGFRGFLSRPLTVERLSPASRKFVGTPSREHIQTLIARSLEAEDIDDQHEIQRILEDNKFQEVLAKFPDQKAGLGDHPPKAATAHSLSAIRETVEDYNRPTPREKQSADYNSAVSPEALKATRAEDVPLTVPVYGEPGSAASGTAGDPEVWKGRSERPVHCETLVLARLHELTHAAGKPTTCYQYIAVTKPCCYGCAVFFEVYNGFSERNFYVHGSHQRVYDLVTFPSLGEELDRKIRRRRIRRFQSEVARIAEGRMGGSTPMVNKLRGLTGSRVGDDWSDVCSEDGEVAFWEKYFAATESAGTANMAADVKFAPGRTPID